MAVINTNVKALVSQAALKRTDGTMSKAMAQLSTGKRINTAGDDAAGLAIATRMTHQIRSLNQAVRNSGDAISLIQTAEGATNEITDMMQRMRELAIQAVNDTNDNAQRSYLDLEFQQLKAEIVHIAEATEWNGFPLLNGTAGERVGEMPVYKTTAVSRSASVFNATPAVSGTDAEEQQTITFSAASFVPGMVITIDGEELTIDDVTVADSDTFAAAVKTQLEAAWATDDTKKNRTIATTATAGQLQITYAPGEGNVKPVSFNPQASGITHEVATVRQALTTAALDFPSGGAFRKPGSLSVAVSAATPPVVTASFTGTDGQSIQMTGVASAANGTVTFKAYDSTDSTNRNALVITQDLVYSFKNSLGNSEALTSRAVALNVSVGAGVHALEAGDLIINGVDIGATYASDDTLSPKANAAGSAIAVAAAINRMAGDTGVSVGESQSIVFSGVPVAGQTITIGGVNIQFTSAEKTSVQAAAKIASELRSNAQFNSVTGRVITYAPGSSTIKIDFPISEGNAPKTAITSGSSGLSAVVDTTQEFRQVRPGTGVYAKVNENILSGSAMVPGESMKGVVFINGYASSDLTSVLNNTRASREQVTNAINAMSAKTGVKAIDTGFDTKGITLVAADGRNIEVRFETQGNADRFGQLIGLKQGVQTSTYSLESKIPAPVVITSATTGSIQRSGLIEGNFTRNQSVFNTSPRPIVAAPVAQTEAVTIAGTGATDAYSVTINGKTYASTLTSAATAEDKRNELITLINVDQATLGVTAVAGRSTGELLLVANTAGTPFTLTVKGDSTNSGSISTSTVAANQTAKYKPLGMDDMLINGIKISPSVAAGDTSTPSPSASNSQAASAIAIAAAINVHSPETGVRAQANPVISKGLYTVTTLPATDGSNSDIYDLFINGTKVSVKFVQNETEEDRRNKVAAAINERTPQHGVTASDNGNGLTLASDGRNVSVWFDSSRQDVSAASFGLDKGGATAQVSKIRVGGTVAADKTLAVVINGVTITSAAADGTDTALTLATKLKTAIQDAITSGSLTNLSVDIDGDSIEITSAIPGHAFTLNGATVRSSIADGSGLYPVETGPTLNLSTVHENSFGNNDVTGIFNGNATTTSARTLYGTVRLISDPALLPKLPSPIGAPPSDQLEKLKATGRAFTIAVGDSGYSKNGNFSAIGFQEGTFGGRSSEDMDPPRVGRLAFQVGASANQYITIDLSDFGKAGLITGELTGDIDKNVEDRSTRINTREGASSVLRILDDAMDKVNATRATMGAVINRLEHVITNLSNVSTNLSASRSQIEDADYAAASTELAKTQIMQQAATAVLAQANSSQQTVLKLLQG